MVTSSVFDTYIITRNVIVQCPPILRMEDRWFSKGLLFPFVSTFLKIDLRKQTNHSSTLLLTNRHPAALQGIDQSASWNWCKLSDLLGLFPVYETKFNTKKKGRSCQLIDDLYDKVVIYLGGGKDGRIVKYDPQFRITGEEATLPAHLGCVRVLAQGQLTSSRSKPSACVTVYNQINTAQLIWGLTGLDSARLDMHNQRRKKESMRWRVVPITVSPNEQEPVGIAPVLVPQ